MYIRPEDCRGCPLDEKATGFALPVGPPAAPVLLLGEALGRFEAYRGQPFVGPAGGVLDKALRLAGLDRRDFRIHNLVNCFPGSTKFHAFGVQKVYRRWYQGILAHAVTREGALTGTPNHPVLTVRGWLPLKSLVEGDYLVRGSFVERVLRCDPDVEQGPASAADLFNTLAMRRRCRRVVGSNVDFHGDGVESDIDVVVVDDLLRAGLGSPPQEQSCEFALETSYSETGDSSSPCHRLSPGPDLLGRLPSASSGVVSSSYLMGPLFGAELVPNQPLNIARRAKRDTSLDQRGPQALLPDSVALSQFLDACPVQVGLAEVVDVQWRSFSGHVYNFQTAGGQYIADGFIVHNCQPPNDWLDGAPWEHAAVAHCEAHRRGVLAEPRPVIVPLGAIATRYLLGLPKNKYTRMTDLHGTVTRRVVEGRGVWVVPSFHPSFINRGEWRLLGTLKHDIERAVTIAREGWTVDMPHLIVDPPVGWFAQWADSFIAEVERCLREGLDLPWLVVDTETPDTREKGEEDLEPEKNIPIIRINFCCSVDEGITVPWAGAYRQIAERLLALPCPKLFWHAPYDLGCFAGYGIVPAGVILDGMDMWHPMQSDLPRTLGFVASFYSPIAWKHLAATDPGTYAAMDGPQTLRTTYGIIRDLQRAGMWAIYERHLLKLDNHALLPATAVGLPFDRQRLEALGRVIDAKVGEFESDISAKAPIEARPLFGPPGGYKRRPKDIPEGELVEVRKKLQVLCCLDCGEQEVQKRHKCKPREAPIEPAAASSP